MTHRPGPVALTLALLVGIFLLLPLVAVVPISFTPMRFLSIPTGAWSLRHYRELLDDPDWGSAVLLSLRVGLLSSVASTVLGLLFALGIWMTRPRFAAALVGFVLLPMVAPPVVSAITLYFLLTSLSGALGIGYDTWQGVVLAHTVMTVPFAVVLLLVALAEVDPRLDLAARGLGASLWRRAWHVVLPNIRFGIAAAALLCFILSWDEIGVTLFITSVNAITLPRLMWMGLRDNIDPAVASLSVVLIALTVTVLTVRAVVVRLRPSAA